jgi:hypothetical protein
MLTVEMERLVWRYEEDEIDTASKSPHPAVNTRETGAETVEAANNKTDWARWEGLNESFECIRSLSSIRNILRVDS